jgi:hypothetical protein
MTRGGAADRWRASEMVIASKINKQDAGHEAGGGCRRDRSARGNPE